MAVGVESRRAAAPLTACGSSGCGAPNPPLHQAAGRYMPYALVLRKLD
ncbi:MAG: hypothetical protein FWG88_11250 [Oscillospiraceae bacterium]|nr:hypothetical protein [Oscillospiraceae bacterium]